MLVRWAWASRTRSWWAIDAMMSRWHAPATCLPCVGVELGHTAKSGELERARASVVVSTVDELSDVLLGEAAKN